MVLKDHQIHPFHQSFNGYVRSVAPVSAQDLAPYTFKRFTANTATNSRP